MTSLDISSQTREHHEALWHNRLMRQLSPGLGICLLLSGVLHSTAMARSALSLSEMRAYARDAHAFAHDVLVSTLEVDTQPEPPPPAPEVKEDPPPQAEPEPPTEQPPPKAEKRPESAPAAAKAAQVLTAKEDPQAPVDLTGFSMVQGNASTYAGGVTAANGTSNQAVSDKNARPNGVVGGKGTADSAQPGGPDRSKTAAPASRDWNCSHLFPSEADADDINSAVVSVVVTVKPDGTAQSVAVVNDPGHGFGRAAKTCAMSQRYAPALDRVGQAAGGKTLPFTVRFTR